MPLSRVALLALPALALLAAGCSRQEPALGANYTAEQQQALDSLNEAEGWRATPSGLRYRKVGGTGSGQRPTPSDVVTLHYEGRLTNGMVFDSSLAGDPVTFPLPDLVRGWQEGVPMMSVGEEWEFALPPELGYGNRMAGPIPPGSVLFFKIRLLGIGPRG